MSVGAIQLTLMSQWILQNRIILIYGGWESKYLFLLLSTLDNLSKYTLINIDCFSKVEMGEKLRGKNANTP